MPTITIADDDDGIRLDRWFQRHAPGTSFNVVSCWARTGAIRLNGTKAAPGDRIAAGQTLIYPDALPVPTPASRVRPEITERDPLSAAQIEYIQSLVIYEDRHAIVINKPPGLATQGGIGITTHVDGLLDGLLETASGSMTTRPKLVHRLDKDTSGVLLLARTARAAAFFSRAFAGRDAQKTYWALTLGVPKVGAGEIDAALSKQPGSGGEKMHVDTETGLKAKTRYRVIERAAARAAWVEFAPLTGRTHQIRVHAAAIGHAIIGDAKYGGKDAFLTGGISRKLHLHARRLVIDAPDGGHIDISADLPPHIAESFAMLGVDPALGAPLVVVPLSATPKPKSRRLSSATSGNRRGERRSRGS